jgi:hypothetical protein
MRKFFCTQAFRTISQPVCSSTICLQCFAIRSFSSSSSARDEDPSSEDGTFKKGKRAKVDPQTVEDWFQGDGLPYLNPTPGKPNWLGGEIVGSVSSLVCISLNHQVAVSRQPNVPATTTTLRCREDFNIRSLLEVISTLHLHVS